MPIMQARKPQRLEKVSLAADNSLAHFWFHFRLSFVGPAIADAITNLGGGGLSSPYLANLANSLNYMDQELLLYKCTIWGYMVSACCSGIIIGGFTSGFLYVAEATAMLSYPLQDERGLYLGIWSAMRSSGSILGGAINFAKNYDNSEAGGITPSTYLLFAALECTGLFWAFNLTPTQYVRRSNGSKIPTPHPKTWQREFVALRHHARQKKTWLLSIPAFYSFYHGGTLSSYLSLHFSIRSRALSSFISPSLAVPSVIAYGRLLLDVKHLSQRKRAKIAVLIWVIPQMMCLLWLGFENYKFERGMPILDYKSNLRQWTEAFLPSLFMFISGCFTQLSLYWIIGTFTNNMGANSQLGGLFRAFETAGQAVSYAMNSGSEEGVRMSFYLNIFLLLLTIPCMVELVQLVPLDPIPDEILPSEETCFINDS